MYNIYDESDTKVFGCSSLQAVIEYAEDMGVVSVTSQPNTFNNKREIRVILANSEHIILEFGCPTSAHDWIMKHVPGELVKILSCEAGCEYRYK